MAEKYMCIKMEDGAELYFQTISIRRGGEKPASGENPVVAVERMSEAMPAVRKFCKKMKDGMQNDLNPDEIEFEFSVGLSGEMKAVIASAGAEAGVKVRMLWKK